MNTNSEKIISMIPDKNGFYGEFGGAFIPEMLQRNIAELKIAFEELRKDDAFNTQFSEILCSYCGRKTPLTRANNISKELGAQIFFKREDLNHTGAHKITNAIGQVLLAIRMGKKHIIAETGAGQHGVATATACALFGLSCEVFMGAKDMKRQATNVRRMKLLGAKVTPVYSGTKTLKDATNEAIRQWINDPQNTYYLIGSTVGPHPYPEIVAFFQSVISKEIKEQLDEKKLPPPNRLIACIGGGSNAAGTYYHYIDHPCVRLIGVEAAGEGIHTSKTAASATLGTPGVLHGSMTLLMQNQDGQIVEPHSISAGLDYPGIGPIHAYMYLQKRLEITTATDQEAIEAAFWCTKSEGIIPALESAHALAALRKMKFKPHEIIVLCMSGRGDKDLSTYLNHIEK